MTLAELMAQHPHLATEIKALEKASFDAGAIAGKAEKDSMELEARVKAATPFLTHAEGSIRTLAAEVIGGTKHLDALTSVADLHAKSEEAAASAAAAEDSKEIPETPGDGQDAVPTLKTEVARMRAIRYGEGK